MRPKPKMNPLDKRIKPNPKYSKVAVSFLDHIFILFLLLSDGANDKHWKQSEERA